MTTIDIITMLGNLSQSLYPVQRLITGFAYIIGILFILTALGKFRKIGDARMQSGSQEKMFIPFAYLIAGIVLIYLPTALKIMAGSAFGPANVLAYSNYNPYNIYSVIGVVVQTAGIIWFIRGAILLAHASEPSVKEGSKGLIYLIAGILAINFDNTIAIFNSILDYLIRATTYVTKR